MCAPPETSRLTCHHARGLDGNACADLASDVAQRMLQRVDSCASVDPFAAQQQQQQHHHHHAAAGAGMQQHYHSANSLQAQVSASSPASYALHGQPSAGHLHASPDSNSGAATGDAAGGDSSVHRGVSQSLAASLVMRQS